MFVDCVERDGYHSAEVRMHTHAHLLVDLLIRVTIRHCSEKWHAIKLSHLVRAFAILAHTRDAPALCYDMH